MIAFLAALLLAALPAGAQTLTTINENLATSSNTMLVDTDSNRLDVGTASYTGSVPGAVLFVGSNVVVSTGTGGSPNVVIYATGTIDILGHSVSTTDPAGVYVPYAGATANVNLGAKTLTTTGNIQVGQVGAGTAASTNYYFDGLSASGGGYVRIGAGSNQPTGYYWGGTRGYSMQERYDLSGTPFTLHDELNNVDRFYLDTSGMWYFPSASITASSFTALGTGFKGALQGNATTATSATTAGTITGNITPAQMDGSTYTASIALKAPLASPTFTGTVSGAAGVFSGTFTAGGFASSGSIIASSGTFTATGDGQYSVLASSGIKASAGDICTASVCLNSVSGGGSSWTGAGYVIASSVTISGATSTTISGLNGNSYGRIRIVVEGALAATSDAAITKLQFNSDTTGYKSEGAFLYGGGAGAIALITNGLILWRQYGTAINPVEITAYIHSAAYSSGIQRAFNCSSGGSQVGVGGFSVKSGGAWTDTSSNITGITFVWASAFTGNVYIYQD